MSIGIHLKTIKTHNSSFSFSITVITVKNNNNNNKCTAAYSSDNV